MGYDIPSDHHSAGYDEYDRKPRKAKPQPMLVEIPPETLAALKCDHKAIAAAGVAMIDHAMGRMFTDGEPSTVQMGVDSKVSVGFTPVLDSIPPNWTLGGMTVEQMVADVKARQIEAGMDAAQSLLAKKPRVRVHTFVGGHSGGEYTRVMFAHAEPRLSMVRWMTNALDAWADFARRLRLGQP